MTLLPLLSDGDSMTLLRLLKWRFVDEAWVKRSFRKFNWSGCAIRIVKGADGKDKRKDERWTFQVKMFILTNRRKNKLFTSKKSRSPFFSLQFQVYRCKLVHTHSFFINLTSIHVWASGEHMAKGSCCQTLERFCAVHYVRCFVQWWATAVGVWVGSWMLS